MSNQVLSVPFCNALVVSIRNGFSFDSILGLIQPVSSWSLWLKISGHYYNLDGLRE
ncbi:hypothetical protein Pcar_3174 [Syntrophotalea carbinolica DSM 2380]|uniref:Uncharacterized protein n=1 Tax=Syntrophotalea carbinolica (strain DSM 2380 / NBRC 103641 / GraBd1) TaxID=338963 RepID=Q0C6Z3_SYNC1|nr:hypothetical protein Pcar_3174 [Syntrophotalea carbinolica DSM 2380]